MKLIILRFLSIFFLVFFLNVVPQSLKDNAQSVFEPGTIEIDSYGFEMVYVPGGNFEMGIESERYSEGVRSGAFGSIWEEQEELVYDLIREQGVFDAYIPTVSNFWIDRYEVTIEQYNSFARLCMDTGRCSDSDLSQTPELMSDPRQPQINVTWLDAVLFCTGREARLPTEEEWEYAASGPENLNFPWGDTLIPEYLAGETTYPVGSVTTNVSWVGAYDLVGNAAEWVEDRLAPYPNSSSDYAPISIFFNSDTRRVIRGGSYRTSILDLTTFSRRWAQLNSTSEIGVGFRCVRSDPPN
jgi:formylglycine-generating enzyme required for sulfatase activity